VTTSAPHIISNMKLIVAGTTGQVGAAVLQSALKDSAVDHVFSITRKALPSSITSPKLTSVINTDFTSWPESILSQLEGAEACIWAVGTIPKKGDGSVESYSKTDVGTTKAAAEAFTKALAPGLQEREKGRKFRFVYTSAMGAERDSSKSLWLLPGPRISKVRLIDGLHD
jgi:hypothetical protein